MQMMTKYIRRQMSLSSASPSFVSEIKHYGVKRNVLIRQITSKYCCCFFLSFFINTDCAENQRSSSRYLVESENISMNRNTLNQLRAIFPLRVGHSTVLFIHPKLRENYRSPANSAATGSQVADCYRETVPSRNSYRCTHPHQRKLKIYFCLECMLNKMFHRCIIKAFRRCFQQVSYIQVYRCSLTCRLCFF